MRKTNPMPGGIVWRQPDGNTVSCKEKLKVLNENLSEIREYCQDAFEDALLMGCDEVQIRNAFESVIHSLDNPYKNTKEKNVKGD